MIKETIEENKFIYLSPSFVLVLKYFIPSFLVLFVAWGYRYYLQDIYQEMLKIAINGSSYTILVEIGIFPKSYSELIESFLFNLNPFWFITIPILLWLSYILLSLYTTNYFVKKIKLSLETGIFDRHVDWVDFNQIVDIDIHSPLWLRIFGKSNIIFLTEDYSGNTNFLIKRFGVPKHITERIEEANTKSELRALDIKVFYGINSKKATELINYIKEQQNQLVKEYKSVHL